jgi:beta-lactamase regulating signal transducer with metallopeptidase domain
MIQLINQFAEGWFGWEIAMLWQAGLLIAIVAAIDLLIKKWAWPQVRYALWMLILVKLVLPPSLTSPVSFTAEMPFAVKQMVTNAEYRIQNAELGTQNTEYKIQKTNPKQTQITEIQSADAKAMADKNPKMDSRIRGNDRVTWKVYAMFVWLGGAAILTGWLVMRLRGLRREHLEGEQILPERLEELLAATAKKLNLRRIPQVILTDKVCCPAVFGVFRPVLLMPAGKLANMTLKDAENIFLHELAHIKRGDLLAHAVYMILQIAYWFNPLVWLVRKPMQNLRELCCDATVARLLKERTADYRQTLLDTARELLAVPVDPGLGLLGLFENSSWLLDRLSWLEKKSWKYRSLRIATIFILICLMSACVLPMGEKTKTATVQGEIENTEKQDGFKGFKVTLSNGTVVELAGVCEHPSESKQWWAPDGNMLEKNPYDKINVSISSGFGRQAIEAAVQISNYDANDGIGFRCQVEDAKNSGSGDCRKDNRNLAGLYSLVFDQPKNSTSSKIKLGIASGSWMTLQTKEADFGGVYSQQSIVWHAPVANDGKTVLNVAHTNSKMNVRVIAIDKSGKEYAGSSSSGWENDFESVQTEFSLPLSDIKEFKFQARPYEWVEFKNVSLKPGFDTNVRIGDGEPAGQKEKD